MKATFKLTNPDDVVATLTITATLGHWRELREQLLGKYPSWELSRTISDLIWHAQQEFYPKETDV